MAIRPEEVRHVAALARLEVGEADVARIAAELSAVLDYARALKRLDLSGCEPADVAPAGTELRADVADGRGLTPGQALAMAPDAEGGFFVVPPVIEVPEP